MQIEVHLNHQSSKPRDHVVTGAAFSTKHKPGWKVQFHAEVRVMMPPEEAAKIVNLAEPHTTQFQRDEKGYYGSSPNPHYKRVKSVIFVFED